eukprot:GHVT01073643.1.p1 GENE.GHVT01073643.1~~GHVT01073643.1.p1  ORF type:complete len:106 (-),score=6.56 GHVT01073643.1:77-394(-)
MHKWPQGRGGSGILQCIRYGGSSCHSDKRAPRGKAQLALDDANLLLLHDGGDQQLLLVHYQWGLFDLVVVNNWGEDLKGMDMLHPNNQRSLVVAFLDLNVGNHFE